MKVALATAAWTVAAYLAWLGWDQQRNPDGTGPYEAWQVIGLAMTLGAVAAFSSWRSADVVQPLVVAVLVTIVLTVAWSIDAATDRTLDGNLWPVGAILLANASGCGLILVAVVTRAVRQRTHPHRGRSHSDPLGRTSRRPPQHF
jgi:hypothetical protein